MAASLYWVDRNDPLTGRTDFAYLPLDVSGASFFYTGGRAIPPDETRVVVRLISADFQRQETVLA